MKDQKPDIEKLITGWKVPEATTNEAAWAKINEKLQRQQTAEKTKRRLPVWVWPAVAASILMFFMVAESGIIFKRIGNSTLSKQIVWLPDSSQVELKTHSEIKYSYGWISGSRKVELKGEAFFDVKEGKTFRVKFPGGQLQVLGTQFNIQAYSPESGRVDCYDGAVKLSVQKKNFVLEKGKSLVFEEEAVDGPFEFAPEEKLVLPDNTYYWKNRPLKEILALICQRQGYQLEAPEHLLSRRFTGKVSLSQPENGLKVIATAMDFRFQIENNKLRLFDTK